MSTTTSECVYLPEFDGEWSIMSRTEYDTTGGEAEYGPAEPAELVFSLGGHRGHYLTADFLSEAADLLESCQLDCATYHLDDPENFGLRDRVDQLKDEANDAWARYHTHNDVHGLDHAQITKYGGECPIGSDGYPDCMCFQGIHDLAEAMESVLMDLGFLTEWNDGVYVYRVGGAS